MTNEQYETLLLEMRTIRALLEEMKTVRIETKVSEVELKRIFDFDGDTQLFNNGFTYEQVAAESND